MSTGSAGSKPGKVAGVYDPARSDQVHVRSRIMGIYCKCNDMSICPTPHKCVFAFLRGPGENRLRTLKEGHIPTTPSSLRYGRPFGGKVSETPTPILATRREDPTETIKDLDRLQENDQRTASVYQLNRCLFQFPRGFSPQRDFLP